MNDLRKLVSGPPQQFEPPNWLSFLEQRWKRWEKENDRADLNKRAAFTAGWMACMEELSQTSREDSKTSSGHP